MLINQKQVKKFALDFAKSNRNHKFTRVSKEFTLRMDAQLRVFIEREVLVYPSKGRTLQ